MMELKEKWDYIHFVSDQMAARRLSISTGAVVAVVVTGDPMTFRNRFGLFYFLSRFPVLFEPLKETKTLNDVLLASKLNRRAWRDRSFVGPIPLVPLEGKDEGSE
jgi:hypothetical protein